MTCWTLSLCETPPSRLDAAAIHLDAFRCLSVAEVETLELKGPGASVRLGDLFTDYGVGLRLGRPGGPGLRTDVAFGGESRVRFVVGFATGF